MGEDGQAAIVELGAALSGTQARSIAASLEAGETLTQALGVVEQSSRRRLRELMSRAGLGVLDQTRTIAVLRAIEGAHTHPTSITPMWTVPGGPGSLGVSGHLTGLTRDLVAGAYSSVTCSTYNIARSSALWTGGVSDEPVAPGSRRRRRAQTSGDLLAAGEPAASRNHSWAVMTASTGSSCSSIGNGPGTSSSG